MGPVVLGQDLSLGKALGFGVVRPAPCLCVAPPACQFGGGGSAGIAGWAPSLSGRIARRHERPLP
jgi:hypothetical protein